MGETMVVAADRIGLVLQIADTKLGADGVQVTLTAKALEVVKHAHEWTSWPKALHGTKEIKSLGLASNIFSLFEAVLWIKSMGQTSNFPWLKSLNRFEDFNSRLQPRDFSQE